ncbi:unnamed protein product [Spirodela intermedia]|uniref:non-specific serine/threonine protein kinase n=1 Tax=Spirodela intermedia TaxID=51605 RepID=A0A7I8JRT9_SPIIN|nr:unnamed protein product [Spirodela intermedia]CAA6672849.1 unnamed protein product [Spirodela intermedia]
MGSRAVLQLLCFLVLAAVAHGQSTSGFISIDCGLEGDSNSTDQFSGIIYSPDAASVDGGVNMAVPMTPDIFHSAELPQRDSELLHDRTPGGGGKYLVRAGFLYGNHDGKNQTPEFDLYLGVNFWQTVQTLADDTVIAEIIAIAPANVMKVCLVNIGMGTPFISVVELRSLRNFMYPLVNESQSLELDGKRVDYGGSESTRYPVDPYDRIWFAKLNRTGWRTVRTNGDINRQERDTSLVPAELLRTATFAESLAFNFSRGPQEKLYLFMYFAEVEQLGTNETRELNVFSNGQLWYGPYRPKYLTAGALYTSRAGTIATYNFTFEATANSTLPPIINAREVYSLKQVELSPTDARKCLFLSDVTAKAMLKIKDFYKVKKNWQGDPCVPRNLTWEGVSCGYNVSENPRIVSLNLSHSGLAGGISPYIIELTALKTLDLSSNDLTGEILDDLVKLPNLQVLNLMNNQLTGKIPEVLYNKSQNGTLSLSTVGNTKLCNKVDSCGIINGKKKNIIPIVVGVSVSAIVIFGIFILVWRLRGRKRGTVRSEQQVNRGLKVKSQQQDLNLKSYQFSFSDIIKITRNFQSIIGRGGFGIVYYGLLNDRREVVVKMLSQSSQGVIEFHGETQILSRVHHKNLVYLIGYCDDKNNLALPSIVHRDVKTRNILLSAKLEAKLGHFGYLYYQTYRLSEKSDVYSFGVVLLEIIIGQPSISHDSAPIVPCVGSRLERGDISSIVDHKLNGDNDLNPIWKAVEVAMVCASPTSSRRPKMSEVVVRLKECLESGVQRLNSKYIGPIVFDPRTTP